MDDQQSYALLQDALKSQEITQIVYEKIYGVDEAINSKKRVDPTKVVDNIGFTIDLIKESVRPMDKGLEKLFIVFFCIFKMSSPMSLRERQVVAGTAQAYCKCMKGMSEFIDPLHKFCVGTEFEKRTANASQRQCAQHWQAALLGTFEDYSKWEVPIRIVGGCHTGSEVSPQYRFISDASEKAAGIFIYSIESGEILAWSRVFFGWDKDSCHKSKNNINANASAQNLREFMSDMFMRIMLAHSNIPSKNAIVEVWGDNTTALTWIRENRCKSQERASQLAFIGNSLCIQATDIYTHRTYQLKSKDMGYVDLVSRSDDDEGELSFLPQNKKVDMNANPCIIELLHLCDPYDIANNDNCHDAYVKMARLM